MNDGYDIYRKRLHRLIDTVRYVVCYIRRDNDLLNAIENYCNNLPIKHDANLNEKAYWMLNSLKDYPTCQYDNCNNNVSFRGLKIGYAIGCCNSHSQLIVRPNIEATNIIRYGSTTPLQNKEIRNEINKHNLETYGTKHVVDSTYFAEKRIKTCQTNFGVDYPMQSSTVQAKSKKTCKEIYGVEYVLQSDHAKYKGKETSHKLYGTDYPMQSEIVKEKSRSTFQNHYGVNAPAQCPEIRRKQQLRYTYNGISFDSIYEIAYYIWLTDHHIVFEYEPNVRFKYEFDKKEHWYMPDFKIDKQYVEIKGDHFFKDDGTMQNPWDHALDDLYEAKHKCMLANDVKIIRISEMAEILDYISTTYGKNYLKQFRNVLKV